MNAILKLLAGCLTLAGLMLHPAQAAQAPVPINDYLGAWTSTAAPYAAGNVVSYASKTWLSLVDGNTKRPGAAGTANQWRILGDAKTFHYKIGDKGPGGGWIFFVDREDQYPGFTYLEAAPEDVGDHPWCDKTEVSIPETSGWRGDGVGCGKANTQSMLTVCASGAANVAAAYRGPRSKTDWFLPSRAELNLMYTNLRQAGLGGFSISSPSSGWYWSSSQNYLNVNYAWGQGFGSGLQSGNSFKDVLYSVRAVRAF